MIPSGSIKVLVVDPSAALRTRVSQAFSARDGFEAVPSAHDTRSARDRIRSAQPDVILLALDLPRNDAVPFVTRLREHYPVPVFLIAPPGQRAGRQAQSAFAKGALDAFLRPRDLDPKSVNAFVTQVAEAVRVAVRRARPIRHRPLHECKSSFTWGEIGIQARSHVIAIGASTGGTEATLALLQALPPNGPPILVVQHMPPGFTKSYAGRLNRLTPHRVREAGHEQPLLQGEVLVAPGDYHIEVCAPAGGLVAKTHQGPPVNLHRPSADVLFESVANHFGNAAFGFILSGMGADGAAGLLKMRQAGALTFGQSRASSVVYGMPQAAARMGAVLTEAAPHDLPTCLAEAWKQQHASAASTAGSSRAH